LETISSISRHQRERLNLPAATAVLLLSGILCSGGWNIFDPETALEK
jgi:TRAP-type C4-dicarboxylate transport system permease small subunit